MKKDGIRNMALQVVGEGEPHVDDPNRGVTDKAFQFGRFNQAGSIEILDGRLFGKGDGRKQEKYDRQHTP
jgi:hypothetical protein